MRKWTPEYKNDFSTKSYWKKQLLPDLDGVSFSTNCQQLVAAVFWLISWKGQDPKTNSIFVIFWWSSQVSEDTRVASSNISFFNQAAVFPFVRVFTKDNCWQYFFKDGSEYHNLPKFSVTFAFFLSRTPIILSRFFSFGNAFTIYFLSSGNTLDVKS